MLRASRKALKPGGLLSFLVIGVGDDLSSEETEQAKDAGPEYAASDSGYPSLLRTAGFENIELIDVSDDYVETFVAWIREWDSESAELGELIGVDEFAERQTRRRESLPALRKGLLRRYLVSARTTNA